MKSKQLIPFLLMIVLFGTGHFSSGQNLYVEIKDAETYKAISNARVELKSEQANIVFFSSPRGEVIEYVPNGFYTITITRTGYITKILYGIEIKKHEITTLSISLNAGSTDLSGNDLQNTRKEDSRVILERPIERIQLEIITPQDKSYMDDPLRQVELETLLLMNKKLEGTRSMMNYGAAMVSVAATFILIDLFSLVSYNDTPIIDALGNAYYPISTIMIFGGAALYLFGNHSSKYYLNRKQELEGILSRTSLIIFPPDQNILKPPEFNNIWSLGVRIKL